MIGLHTVALRTPSKEKLMIAVPSTTIPLAVHSATIVVNTRTVTEQYHYRVAEAFAETFGAPKPMLDDPYFRIKIDEEHTTACLEGYTCLPGFEDIILRASLDEAALVFVRLTFRNGELVPTQAYAEYTGTKDILYEPQLITLARYLLTAHQTGVTFGIEV